MSFQSNNFDISLLAAADYSTTGRFRGVAVDANGAAVVASAAGQSCIGVLQTNPIAGVSASVRIAGVTKMQASAAIAKGALVAVAADGRAKTAVLSSGAGITGSDVLGIALEAATQANDLIAVLIQPRGAVPTTAA